MVEKPSAAHHFQFTRQLVRRTISSRTPARPAVRAVSKRAAVAGMSTPIKRA
ncbi:MAG TPA: hypothetical protein VFZ76_00645 [Anaerolineales bacterium]